MDAIIANLAAPLIAVVVPLVVAAFKTYIWVRVPSLLLPILAVILGPLFDLLITYVTNLRPAGTALAVFAGFAAVGLRELKDQVHKSVKPEA